MAAQRLDPTGPPGGIFADELFVDRGRATIFILVDDLPCGEPVRPMGRVGPTVVPAADLAVIVHAGSYRDIDRAHGALGDYVTRHTMAVSGPLRESYIVGPTETNDAALWRTEIGWPIFPTRPTS